MSRSHPTRYRLTTSHDHDRQQGWVSSINSHPFHEYLRSKRPFPLPCRRPPDARVLSPL